MSSSCSVQSITNPESAGYNAPACERLSRCRGGGGHLLDGICCLDRHSALLDNDFGRCGNRGDHAGSTLPVSQVCCLASAHTPGLRRCVHAAARPHESSYRYDTPAGPAWGSTMAAPPQRICVMMRVLGVASERILSAAIAVSRASTVAGIKA